MKILFLGLKHNYPNTHGELGSCWMNVCVPLRRHAEVIEYSLDAANSDERQRPALYQGLRALIERERPDALMVWLVPWLDEAFFRELSQQTSLVTIGIFGDDDGGFFSDWHRFAKDYVFDWCVVNYPRTLPYYQRWGNNVVAITGIFEPQFYPPRANELQDIEVSFVGVAGRHRRMFVDQLRRRGVVVRCFGRGWEEGFLTHQEMMRVFYRSKINLNLAGRPINSWFDPRSLAGLLYKKEHAPDGSRRYVADWRNVITNVRSYGNVLQPSIRGRLFELMATRSFMLTNVVPYFGNPFREGVDVVHYQGVRDLTAKIRYYLQRPEQREAIAEAAYRTFCARHSSDVVLHGILSAIFAGNPKRRDGYFHMV